MRSKLKATLQNPYMRGGIALSIASFGVGFINYASNALIARGLGSGGYGEYATVISYVALLTIPLATISTEIIKKIKQHTSDTTAMNRRIKGWEDALIRSAWHNKYAVVLLPIVIVIIQRATSLTWFSSAFLVLLGATLVFGTFYMAVAQGAHEFGKFTAVAVAGALVKLMGAVIVAYVYQSLYVVLFFIVLSSIPPLLLRFSFVARLTSHHAPNMSRVRLRSIIFRPSVIITTGSLLGFGLLGSVDVMIAKHVLSAQNLGLLGGWSLLAKIITYVFGPLFALSIIYFSDPHALRHSKMPAYASLFLLLAGIVVANIAYSILGGTVIHIVLGDSFLSIAPHAAAAAVYGSLMTCCLLFTNYFITQNSRIGLLPLFVVPLQVAAIAYFHQDLATIFYIDIYAALAVFGGYLIALLLQLNARRTWIPKKAPNIS
jgi:hypothetical protein